jgi:hypothetical protein
MKIVVGESEDCVLEDLTTVEQQMLVMLDWLPAPLRAPCICSRFADIWAALPASRQCRDVA